MKPKLSFQPYSGGFVFLFLLGRGVLGHSILEKFDWGLGDEAVFVQQKGVDGCHIAFP